MYGTCIFNARHVHVRVHVFLTCRSELLDGLKAHKKKVSKLMARQKNMKFTETDIGKVK